MKIKQIHIDRMPGFKKGLDAYDNLADNINIIAGANGSGKSSTARLIQKLLWWDKSPGLEARAEIRVNDEKHRIEISSPQYVHWDDKNRKSNQGFPNIAPAEFAGQYMLALHDLIHENNQNLAKQIADDINGGIDLNKAAQDLKYSNAIVSTKKNEFINFNKANDSYKTLFKEQERIRHQEKDLSELKKQKEDAEQAIREKELYGLLKEYLQMKEAFAAIEQRFATFPPVLNKLREDDLESIEATEEQIELLLARNKKIEDESLEYKEQLAKLRIPSNGIMPIDLATLKDCIDKLEENEQRLHTLADSIVNANTRKDDAARRLNITSNGNEFTDLSREEVIRLEDFTQEAIVLWEKNRSLLKEKESLEEQLTRVDPKGDLPSLKDREEDIKTGISELSKWLKEQKAPPADGGQEKNAPNYLLLLSVAGIITFILTYFWGIYGLSGLLLIGGILFWALKKKDAPAASAEDLLLTRQRDFLSSKLPPPLAWESSAVVEKIDEYIRSLRSIIQYDELNKSLDNIIKEFDKSQEALKLVDEHYRAVQQTLALSPDFLLKESNKYVALHTFVKHLHAWQAASTELTDLQNRQERLRKEQQQLLQASNEVLFSIGFPEIHNRVELKTATSQIEEEDRLKLLNSEKIRNSNRLIAQNQDRIQEMTKTLRLVFERLAIPDQDKEKVKELLVSYKDYTKTQEEYHRQQTLLNKLITDLHNHPSYIPELENISLPEVEERLNRQVEKAEDYHRLFKEITEIEERIRIKSRQNELEEALARREEALDGLQNVFTANLRSLTGDSILARLREEISLRNENKIFLRANEILGEITKERYKLTLDDNARHPVFRAIDMKLGTVLELSELSTGTRVQLLLAVRLAYIQSQEETLNFRLPLLADELLANSDDERSEVIIDSLIEISKDRQVFYFTAQADEVSKWRNHLEKKKEEIDSRIIILNKDQRLQEEPKADIQVQALYQEIPLPEDRTHQEYGQLLAVGSFDVAEQGVPELHLWFLINDLPVLYNCLSRGITSWGQLRSFFSKGGEISGLTMEMKEELYKRASLLSKLIELHKVGRPKKITKEELKASNAVSENYIEDAFRLIDEYKGNAQQVYEGIKNLPRFTTKKSEDLYDYLVNKEFIDTKEPLGIDELHIELMAECSRLDLDNRLAEDFLNRILHR